jgi:hypothetical protein
LLLERGRVTIVCFFKMTESREFSVSIYNVRARRACTVSASWLLSVRDSADRWRVRGRKELAAGPSDVPHGLPRYSYCTFVHYLV